VAMASQVAERTKRLRRVILPKLTGWNRVFIKTSDQVKKKIRNTNIEIRNKMQKAQI